MAKNDELDSCMRVLIESAWAFTREKLSAESYENLIHKRLYNELYQHSVLAQLNAVFPCLRGRLLDFGCGEGGLTVALRRKGVLAFGVDVRGLSLRIARLRAARYELPRPIFLQYDGRDLPFRSSTFDWVVGIQVFEHVDDQLYYLKEAKRVLKPGGHIYLSFPNAIYPIEPHVHLWFFHWLPSSFLTPVLKIFRPMHVRFMVTNYGRAVYPAWITPGRGLRTVNKVFPNARFATHELWSQKMQGRLGSAGMGLIRKFKPVLDNKIGVLLYRYLGKQIAIMASR